MSLYSSNLHRSSCRSALRNFLRPEIIICFLTIALALLSVRRSEGSDPQQASLAGASKADVAIDNFSFLPKEITVVAGTTVDWTNHDDVPHVVASADDQFKKSGPWTPMRVSLTRSPRRETSLTFVRSTLT